MIQMSTTSLGSSRLMRAESLLDRMFRHCPLWGKMILILIHRLRKFIVPNDLLVEIFLHMCGQYSMEVEEGTSAVKELVVETV